MADFARRNRVLRKIFANLIHTFPASTIIRLAACWRERECRPGNLSKCGAGGSRNGSGQIRPWSRWKPFQRNGGAPPCCRLSQQAKFAPLRRISRQGRGSNASRARACSALQYQPGNHPRGPRARLPSPQKGAFFEVKDRFDKVKLFAPGREKRSSTSGIAAGNRDPGRNPVCKSLFGRG
jgi:hypothetical protein